jgi:hypothetical protein
LKIFRRPKSKEYWKFKTVNILKIMGRKTNFFKYMEIVVLGWETVLMVWSAVFVSWHKKFSDDL